MSALARRPLLVVSLAVSGIALLCFLWQRRRKEECEENCAALETPEFVWGDATAREVSVKLESLKRSRLENIEEEDKLPEEDRQPDENRPTSLVLADHVTEQLTLSAEKVENGSLASRSQVSVESEAAPQVDLVAAEISCSVKLASSISSMTEKECEGPAGQEHVPDVQTALKVKIEKFFFQNRSYSSSSIDCPK